MKTLFITHPIALRHEMGEGHPERPDRLRAIAAANGFEHGMNLPREKVTDFAKRIASNMPIHGSAGSAGDCPRLRGGNLPRIARPPGR